MALFKCSVCNYVEEAESIDHECLKCGAPATAFNKLSDEEAKKIYTSDATNDLLMKLIHLCKKMDKLADKGIELKLDPLCVKTFEYAKEKSWEIKQIAKAEIENHVGKGKW